MTSIRHSWRVLVLAAMVMAALGGLGVRLAFLHLGPNDKLRERIRNTRHFELTLHGTRGRIMDRDGKALAMERPGKIVRAEPLKIQKAGHVEFVGRQLARLLNKNPAKVIKRLRRNCKGIDVESFVPTDLAERIARMKLTGVFFSDTAARYYPQSSLMCHVIGFSNYDNIGSAGVEQTMDRYLQSSPGLRVGEKDGRRREIYGRRVLDLAPREGADIYLTLDVTVQHFVEMALARACVEHNAVNACAIVQRVDTGEILAMASQPVFDVNEYGKSSPDQRRNWAVSVNYEPGSTFKIAIIAAALNEGIVTEDTVFDCEEGHWRYMGIPLRDYHPMGKLSVADILKESSNIGAAKIALELGAKRVEDYLRAFGVGRRTGIHLPGEEAGMLAPRSRWSGISITRIAMGHEVMVTALQMLNLVSAIANDGVLMRPYVVQSVVDKQKRVIYEAIPEVVERPLRPDTAAIMCKLLARVTEEGGTGTRAVPEGFSVAGKTGTAQKVVDGHYSTTENVASFVGFLPADDPIISIIVVVDNPQPVHTGGRVAAPVFREIAGQTMRYLASSPQWKTPVPLANYGRGEI